MLDRAGSPLVVLGSDDVYSEPLTIEQVLALDDDEQLITALWHLSHRRLLRRALAQGLTLEAAEDAVQDVFSMLADQLQRVRGPALGGWLAKMVDYECKRYFSAQKRARGNLQAVQERADLDKRQHDCDDPELTLIRQHELGTAMDLLLDLEPLEAFIMRATIVDKVPTTVVLDVIKRRFEVCLTPAALYERRRRVRQRLAKRMAHGLGGRADGGDHG